MTLWVLAYLSVVLVGLLVWRLWVCLRVWVVSLPLVLGWTVAGWFSVLSVLGFADFGFASLDFVGFGIWVVTWCDCWWLTVVC